MTEEEKPERRWVLLGIPLCLAMGFFELERDKRQSSKLVVHLRMALLCSLYLLHVVEIKTTAAGMGRYRRSSSGTRRLISSN